MQPIDIFMNAVESSNIESIGYNETHQLLRVYFRNGTRYSYKKVPAEIWNGFCESNSKGAYLAKNIKDKFECEKDHESNEKIAEYKG